MSIVEDRARELGARMGRELCELVTPNLVPQYIQIVNDSAAEAGIRRRAVLQTPTVVWANRIWAEMLLFAAFQLLSRALHERAQIVKQALKGVSLSKALAEEIGGEVLDAVWIGLCRGEDSPFPQDPYEPDVPGTGPSCIEEEFVWARSSEYVTVNEQQALALFVERVAQLVAGFGKLHSVARANAIPLASTLSVLARKAVDAGAAAIESE